MKNCIIITDAGKDIGRATAEKLAQMGYPLALNYYRQAVPTATLEQQWAAYPQPIKIYYADVADHRYAHELIDQIKEDFPSIYGLVNNYGEIKNGALTQLSEQDFRDVLYSTLESTFYMNRLAGQEMLNNRCGSIVNCASLLGLQGNAGQCCYATAKGALIGMTKSMAKELGCCNIRFNTVAAGCIEPENCSLTDSQRKALSCRIALRRMGYPNEVAEAIYFLLSPASSYITGALLPVDGNLAL